MGIKHVKTLLRNEENNKEFQAIKEVFYTPESLKEAKTLFLELKKESIIASDSYDQDIWEVEKTNQQNKYLKLKFDIDMFPELKKALKVYATYQISNISTLNVATYVRFIKKGILATNGLQVKNIEKLDASIENEKNESLSYIYAKSMISFIEFINHSAKDDYFEKLEVFKQPTMQVRDLVNFKDLLIFGEVITQFQRDCTSQEKLLYFPIILWWKITNIIPMRTSDFVNIKRNCLTPKNERYFITIPRSKDDDVKRHAYIKITDTLPISKEIYDLVQEYIDLTEPYGISHQLLSTFAHSEAIQRKAFSEVWHSERFRLLLIRFYDEIVIEKFGKSVDIERMQPMDTRHYAFMNMMFMGFNALTIARMGGHKKLHSQFTYHGHMAEYAESYVYQLTQNRFRGSNEEQSAQQFIHEKHPAIKRGRMKNPEDYEFYHRLKPFGRCTFDLENYGCPFGGECKHCDYFVIPYEEQTLESIQWLQDCSLTLAKELREQIALMQEVTKGMNYDFTNLDWLPTYGDEELKTLTRSITSLMIKKANVDALIKEAQTHE